MNPSVMICPPISLLFPDFYAELPDFYADVVHLISSVSSSFSACDPPEDGSVCHPYGVYARCTIERGGMSPGGRKKSFVWVCTKLF